MKIGCFITKDNNKLNYILHGDEDNYNGKKALIVYLHGMDGCDDNVEKLLNIESLPSYIESGKISVSKDLMILSPQCPEGTNWSNISEEVIELIDDLVHRGKVDENKISLTGVSLGGMGTFDIAIKYPDKFSCIVPVCASVDAKKCSVLTKMPVWIFHGELDTGMGFSVVEANAVINLAGGNSRITLLPHEGHEIRWIYYSDRFDIIQWVTSQTKNNI